MGNRATLSLAILLTVVVAGLLHRRFEKGPRPNNASSLSEPAATGTPPSLDELPLRPLPRTIVSLSIDRLAVATEVELNSVFEVAVPRFSWRRVHVPLVLHALRCWGTRASFEEMRADRRGELATSGDRLLEILLDDRAYRSYTKTELDGLLRRSPYGVRVVSNGDMTLLSKWGESHFGEFVSVMAEAGVPSDAPLVLSDGTHATLGQAIRDSARRASANAEPEWICEGLSRYLEVASWQNRFGSRVSFDSLALSMLTRNAGDGPCAGTHVPHALAVLLQADESSRLLSEEIRARIEGCLDQFRESLIQSQQADGSWNSNWAVRFSAAADTPTSVWGDPLLDTVSTTGHVVEYLCIAPPERRPPIEDIRCAVRYLVQHIPRFSSAANEQWSSYLPLSHAARAVALAHGMSYIAVPPQDKKIIASP